MCVMVGWGVCWCESFSVGMSIVLCLIECVWGGGDVCVILWICCVKLCV